MCENVSSFLRRPHFEANGSINVDMLGPKLIYNTQWHIPETGEKGFALSNIYYLIDCNFSLYQQSIIDYLANVSLLFASLTKP